MLFTASGYLVAIFLLVQTSTAPDSHPVLVLTDVIEHTVHDELLQEMHSPAAETLSFVINAGEVLIFNLPPSIEGRQVESYQIKKSPALSWLTGRSFFWRTLAKDAGKHEIMLSGYRNGVAAEDLVIEVDIR